jgi:hypothetical protein
VRAGAKLTVSVLVVAAAAVLAVVAGVTTSSPERDDAFTIDRFDRQVDVTTDGRLDVVETIEVTFTEPRRGIFRDLERDSPAGSVRYDIEGVDQGEPGVDQGDVDQGEPGAPWTWVSETTDAGDPRIRIGDADVTLEPGPQTYRLRYTIDGLAFRPAARPDQVQVRIDVPGDAWPVDVTETSLTVRLPADPTSVACVVGTAGDDTPCPGATTSERTVVQELPPLGPSETGTVAIELPAAALTATLPEAAVDEVTTRGADRAPFEVPTVPGILVTMLLLAAPASALEALRARHVYRDEVTDPALHDRAVPTAELEPPDGLAPVELAAIDRVGSFLTGGSDLLLGTLIDLQIRGVVRSTGGEGEDQPLTFSPGPHAAEVRDWERETLDTLMPNGSPITFDGEYDATTSQRSSGGTSQLTSHAGRLLRPGSRYVHTGGGALRSWGYGLGVALTVALGVVVGLAATLLFGVPAVAIAVGGVALVIAWVVLALLWRLERRPLTSEGRDVIARTRAFDRFLREVHADRLEYAGGRDDIEVTHPAVALLPYAVVLGLGPSWLDRFEPVLVEAARSGRAGGVSATDTWFLHPASFAAASTLHSSSITDPSSSSSGGGGAGSGGGGGGGGSW